MGAVAVCPCYKERKNKPKNNTMTTKKEILDWVKSIAEHQDLIAMKQNTERKAEAITTHRLLAEIFRALQNIKNILEDAAKEPEPVKEDKPLADIFEDMGKTMKESTLFEDVPKKERKTRRLRPSPEMRQVRSWARHYQWSLCEFSWAMRTLGMPIRESEGKRKSLQYAWLTPEEAEAIDKYLTEMNR